MAERLIHELKRKYPGLARKAGKGYGRAAIRLHCLECVGDSPKHVQECTGWHCFLWPFRLGYNDRPQVVPAEESTWPGMEMAREIATKYPGYAKKAKRSTLIAIRMECLYCQGGSSEAVRECHTSACILHPLRFGAKSRSTDLIKEPDPSHTPATELEGSPTPAE